MRCFWKRCFLMHQLVSRDSFYTESVSQILHTYTVEVLVYVSYIHFVHSTMKIIWCRTFNPTTNSIDQLTLCSQFHFQSNDGGGTAAVGFYIVRVATNGSSSSWCSCSCEWNVPSGHGSNDGQDSLSKVNKPLSNALSQGSWKAGNTPRRAHQ